MARPLIRFLIETFDPAHPGRRIPVGKGATEGEARGTLAKLLAREIAMGTGWMLEIVDTWAEYRPLPA